jgi:hypothetical protein
MEEGSDEWERNAEDKGIESKGVGNETTYGKEGTKKAVHALRRMPRHLGPEEVQEPCV